MAGFKDVVTGSDKLRSQLPFEQFATQPELRFFLDMFLLMPVRDISGTAGLAAVSLDRNKKLLLHVNIKYLNEFPIKEQMYILMHEGAHILLGHLIRCKRIEDRKVWNVATDSVLNSLINRSYGSYVSMPKAEDGHEIGLSLQKLEEEKLIDLNEMGMQENEITSEEVYSLLLKEQEEKDKGSLIVALDGDRIDEHDPHFNADELDDDVKEHINDIVRAAKNGAYGSKAGGFVQDLMKVVKKSFPFEQILDKIIHRDKPDFSRGHRRIHIPGCIFPRKRSEKIKVWAAVDVSGSCFDYIEDFAGYLLALPEIEKVYFFDTGITHTLSKGDSIPKTIPGWGGTDLNPAMAKFAEHEKETIGARCNFVVLTDGEIPPLEVGPVRSRTVIMTTNEEVHYKGAVNPYININISSDIEGRSGNND